MLRWLPKEELDETLAEVLQRCIEGFAGLW